MTKGFVFGKFLPFHKGHEAMIAFALNTCDFLSVLVCCSNAEDIPGTVRKDWIEQTFAAYSNIDVQIFQYDESLLPNTSESSMDVSATWSVVFKKLFPDYSIVVTSEPYGDYVASCMEIEHIAFDMDKNKFPVSASKIRKDVFSYWHFLPERVKPYYACKVVLLGTESTGKTTLTQQLAEYFKCSAVFELAREIIPNSTEFIFDDLPTVASAHADSIQIASEGNSPLVIIDTDIHTTISYGKFMFGKKLDVSEAVYKKNQASLYLYLNNDVAFVQDGTRLDEEKRNRLDVSHRQVLHEHAISFKEISGDWNTRFNAAVEYIKHHCLNVLGAGSK